MEQGIVYKRKPKKNCKLAKPLYVVIKSAPLKECIKGNMAQYCAAFYMSHALGNLITVMADCTMSVSAYFSHAKHVDTLYFFFFPIEMCARQRGLADFYHQTADRSLLK